MKNVKKGGRIEAAKLGRWAKKDMTGSWEAMEFVIGNAEKP
jgi:hypothetical protein